MTRHPEPAPGRGQGTPGHVVLVHVAGEPCDLLRELSEAHGWTLIFSEPMRAAVRHLLLTRPHVMISHVRSNGPGACPIIRAVRRTRAAAAIAILIEPGADEAGLRAAGADVLLPPWLAHRALALCPAGAALPG